MSLNKRIGFMGAGQMAEALARGLIDKGVVQASQICCSDPAAARKELFRSLGATPYDTNLEVRLGVLPVRRHCCQLDSTLFYAHVQKLNCENIKVQT
jgi:hypothetical protein